ncbi:MAG: site-2 protease family protein [Clostridia bacterium]|nr:site-2 protease family protein [Clostridia bacterium]
MIKITRFFYIHWLVLPLFLLSYVSGGFHTMLTAYAVVFVHELFHLFATLLVRERVGSVIIMPFGMTLRLSARIVRQPGKEIFIALAGPFSNLLMLFITYALRARIPVLPMSLYVFWFLNLAVLLLNLLPCLPLDGGRVLKAILTCRLGYLSAASIMRRTTHVMTAVLLCLGISLLVISRLNISLLMAAGFLTLHMAEEKRRNEYILMQELLYTKNKLRKKGLMRSRLLSAMDSVQAKDVFKMLSYESYYIIHIVDENQNHLRSVTEAQVVDAILKKGWHIFLRDI